MSGWVDIVENIELPFRAKGKFTAKGIAFINGKLQNSYDLNAEYIEGIMRASKDYKGLKVVGKTENSLTVEITGKMIGTYGLTSFTKT